MNAVQEMTATRKPRPGGVVVPHAPRWHQRLGAWLVWAYVKCVSATLRCRWHDNSGHFDAPSGPVLYCVWHNRSALTMMAYRSYAQKRNPTVGLVGMASASRDGGFMAAILERFGAQVVRGSTSRRGPQALVELVSWCEKGYDVGITPDGPRGPRYVVQDGIMSLAQLTGRLIIPFSYNLKWKICVHSWDRFQVPLPFSRCDILVEKPIRVPREATNEEREALRLKLEQILRGITKD